MRFGLLVVCAAIGCGGQIAGQPQDPFEPEPQPVPRPAPRPTPPPSDPPTTPAPTESGTTAPLTAGVCLTMVSAPSGGGLRFATIDLAKKSVAYGAKVSLPSDSGPHMSSLGVKGDDAFFCQEPSSEQIIVAKYVDGSLSTVNRACAAVTADANGIYVLDSVGGSITLYPDLAALKTGSPSKNLGKLFASRLGRAASGGVLGAWHATNEILTLDGKLGLEGFDDWIHGLSTSGDRILVSTPRADGRNPGIVAFDAATGANRGVVATISTSASYGMGFQGLACAD